jgi:Ino eighty subunit 1
VFLWLVYHYLEIKEPNPFADEHALKNPGKAPALRCMSQAEAQAENVDSEEEIKWGQGMSAKRNAFLRELVAQQDYEKRTGKSAAPLFISGQSLHGDSLKCPALWRNTEVSNLN